MVGTRERFWPYIEMTFGGGTGVKSHKAGSSARLGEESRTNLEFLDVRPYVALGPGFLHKQSRYVDNRRGSIATCKRQSDVVS